MRHSPVCGRVAPKCCGQDSKGVSLDQTRNPVQLLTGALGSTDEAVQLRNDAALLRKRRSRNLQLLKISARDPLSCGTPSKKGHLPAHLRAVEEVSQPFGIGPNLPWPPNTNVDSGNGLTADSREKKESFTMDWESIKDAALRGYGKAAAFLLFQNMFLYLVGCISCGHPCGIGGYVSFLNHIFNRWHG